MEAVKKENKEAEVVQLDIGFDQIWSLVQQLSVAKRIEFLDKLQAELEAEKHIKPRTDEDQRWNETSTFAPDRPRYNKPSVTQEDIERWEEEEDDEEEELDANMTKEEFLEMTKGSLTFKEGLKSAFKEINQIKKGKKQGTTLNDFLNEL